MQPRNVPRFITAAEWAELASVESIAQSFGITEEERPGQAISECACGAHFDFACVTMPGYVGDLFLLVGDAIDEPLSVIRNRDGRLEELS